MDIKKPNIFIKSLFRQLVRTLLLALLVGAAAFFIVLRIVEYTTISREIMDAEANFRAVGVLTHDDPWLFDVTAASELIRQSEFVAFDNPMPRFSGFLQGDLINANYWPLGMSLRMGSPYRYTDYAIFAGRVQSVQLRNNLTTFNDVITVVVDEVFGGYREHIFTGQHLTLQVPGDIFQYFELQVGGRYLLRGHGMYRGTLSPQRREDIVISTLEPLNAFTNNYGAVPLRSVHNMPFEPVVFTNNDGFIWYAELSENADIPNYDWLMRELFYLDSGMRLMEVYATADMTIDPTFTHIIIRYMEDGRALTRADYLFENAVTVVNAEFLQYNRLEIGNFITVEIVDAHFTDTFFDTHEMPIDYEVWKNAPKQTLTLEIVGTFTVRGHAMSNATFGNLDMFIPLSIVPNDFSYPHITNRFLYSFVLTSARYEYAFLTEMRPRINALDLGVHLTVTPGASEFFDAIDPIMQSLTANFFVFIGVSLAIFALCVFIYLRQTKKNYTIMRYLGVPKRSAALQRFAALLIFWLPSMAVGGVLGYFNALSQIALTLGELGL